eukprot:755671-Hanusia_phi.AAC.4
MRGNAQEKWPANTGKDQRRKRKVEDRMMFDFGVANSRDGKAICRGSIDKKVEFCERWGCYLKYLMILGIFSVVGAFEK